MKLLIPLICSAIVCHFFATIAASAPSLLGADPQAVEDVENGTRTTARASWWGFDPNDATTAIQSAIDSGAPEVIIPYMGQPWVVRPIKLHSDLNLILEPGVILLAKKGEFRARGDSMFTMQDAANVTLRGYGAILRMRKSDYQKPPYEKAEWRMGIRMLGCRHIHIEGLQIESSGGDGLYIDGTCSRPTEDITIRNCVCHDNHRQGMSVICAKDLLVENCVFSATGGTAPEAGIDFEPDGNDQYLVNCVVRNCRFENNSGHAILVYLKQMNAQSKPVSIRFEGCVSRMGRPGMTPSDFDDTHSTGWAGMCVGAVQDDGPQGSIEFINCTVENPGREGAKVFDKSARSAKVRFVRCRWSDPWISEARDYGGPRVPVLFELRRPEFTKCLGGVDFVDCQIYDRVDRPAVELSQRKSYLNLHEVTGNITVHSPAAPRVRVGPSPENVSLVIQHVER